MQPVARPGMTVRRCDDDTGTAVSDRDDAWRAELELAYHCRAGRTVPGERRHVGPLRVLKGLRPEGDAVWHEIVVHPPGGLVGGDSISIDVSAEAAARVLLTTPGATKWYRARDIGATAPASQEVRIRVAARASIEWLPLESIVFRGANARWSTEVDVEADGCFLGAELVCLGRPAAGERFDAGEIGWRTVVRRDGRECFFEQASIVGGSRELIGEAGLGGRPAFGTLLAVPGQAAGTECMRRLAALCAEGQLAVTALPDLTVVRWRGEDAQAGWQALRAAWALLRPELTGRRATTPRIWAS